MFFRLVSLPLSLLVFNAFLSQAEEPVRSAQEELRRRNLYFGDIDGRRSQEYEEAVRKYQRRKGFSPSGHEDPDTLRSLGLLQRGASEPPPKELEWPEEPVLKSDTKIDVKEEAKEVAVASGIAPESIEPVAEAPAATNHTARRTPRGQISRHARTAHTGEVALTEPGKNSQTVSPAQVLKLIEGYLHAMSRGHLDDELALYADHVAYYHNGTVDRRIIEHRLRKYYAQWPNRSYKLAKVTSYASMPKSGEISVSFNVTFSLKNGSERVKGTTDNRIVLNAATSSPRIVAIEERRMRE